MFEKVDQLAINTIRTLSIDAIEKANSGHPGLPMGAAPMAYTLWTRFMNHNPKNPAWFNRDRFVLSAGHGSMLLYSLLHLSGYGVEIEDLKNFRQWGSRTPGHPEYGYTPGVEATTGPLGQGIAMAVGMALAERHLSAVYNKNQYDIVDHYTYALCGDGDLMEGVASEAASLAGHLKLGKMILLYDSNDITLDGELDKSFSENVGERFKAYGWHYIKVEDGNNLEEIAKAIEAAKAETSKPSLIEVKTVIGYGSPNKSGKSAVHGAPLGESEMKLTKEYYKWTFEEDFYVPSEVYDVFEKTAVQNGKDKEAEWESLFAKYKENYPELAVQLETAISGKLPDGWDKDLPVFEEGKSLATRKSSNEALNGIAKNFPHLLGGAADLAGSNYTMINGETDLSADNFSGKNVWFGVREFGMAAAMNGIALHGGLKVFGGTFFVFSDYLRPAIRLAALMELPVTYVLTHDSIAVGEDGPTHEPIEQLASLRAMPGLSIIRPGDANETAAAWRLAIESNNKPTALVLTRQNLPTLPGTAENARDGVEKGAYVISPSKENVDALLLATGSEVNLAVEAQKALAQKGINVSVVSMPSWDRFEAQTKEYKESVLPRSVKKRLAIEMGSSFGWERYTGDEGDILAIDKFGASAPGEKVIEEYGFTVENVVAKVENLLQK
ncbi:transketolase [Lederbergia wuyishanensis]|uniref:Transketolase n=1 Tax=Lederbergia wuyishanensis TaxID=1347903 RepID=A0ABU0CZZ7_9BACI|nr:transketolase [Lederbergia wuyishanensis]MCJ8006368.1 transketolase [Lederbergia wuyishanensis]MDQ0341737.1 transketolase [Lederbergia wuyishanensis]